MMRWVGIIILVVVMIVGIFLFSACCRNPYYATLTPLPDDIQSKQP